MPIYKLLSVLLCYPSQALIDAIPEIRQRLERQSTSVAAAILPLLAKWKAHDLIELEEAYVVTFDKGVSHSLYLFEHIHGEDKERGQAMVDLLAYYEQQGYALLANDLPDYLPLFLEFLSILPEKEAATLLSEVVDILQQIGDSLQKSQSPYAGLFSLLVSLSPIKPKPRQDLPDRRMDDLWQTADEQAEGIEPLLTPAHQMQQPIRFYPKRS